MSPWVPKLSKLSSGAKPESAPIQERAPSDTGSEFPASGPDRSFSYDVDSFSTSNYAMSDAGGPTNVDDSSILDSDYAKSEGPVNSESNDAVAHSLFSAEDDFFTDQDPAYVAAEVEQQWTISDFGNPTNVDSNDIQSPKAKSEGPVNLNSNVEDVNFLSGVEGVDQFTDPEAPHVAAKVEQQWNEYSQKHAVEQALHKVEPKTSLRKKRILLVLGVLVVASVAIAVGIMVSTKPSTPSSAGTDLAYSPVTFSPADVPVNPPGSAPDKAKSATPTMAPSVPSMAPSVATMAPSVPTMAPSVPTMAPSSVPTMSPSVPTMTPAVPTSAPSVEVAETTAVPTVASGGNAPDEGQQGENNGGQGDDAPNDDATDQGQQGENIGSQGEDAPNEDATDQNQQGENNGGQGEGGPNEDAPDEGQQGENNGDQGEDRPNDNGTDQGQQGENNGGPDEGAPGEGNQDNAGEQDKEGEQDKNGEGAPK
jgi:hypothetical protein